MGVGHYRSEGLETFIVSEPSLGDDAYKAYAEDVRASGDDPVDVATWRDDEARDFQAEIADQLRRAGLTLGFVNSGDVRTSYKGPDGDMTVVFETPVAFVGWRGWESGPVVAAGPDSSWAQLLDDPDANAAEIVEATGRPPEAVVKAHGEHVAALSEFVRLRMQLDGFGCRFTTSSWTSQTYPTPDNPETRLAELAETVRSTGALLSVRPAAAVAAAAPEERADLLRSLASLEAREHGIATLVPVYHAENSNIVLFDPDREGMMAVCSVPRDLRTFLEGLPSTDGWTPVPRVPETEAWFAARGANAVQRGRPELAVTAEEWAAARGEECVMSLPEDGTPAVDLVLAEAPDAPAPSPR